MKKYLAAVFCFVLLLGGIVAVAQTVTGSVRGTVTDPSGAAVVGAKVVIANTATGVTTSTVTDKSGLYNVAYLVLGNDYTVTITAPGFDTATVGPFIVQIDQIVTANAKLHLGKTSTTVSVQGDEALLLDTENSTISTSISATELENMPIDGLNIQQATLFVPGAINPSASAMGGQLGTERDSYTPHEEGPGDAIPSFNGNRQQSNSYILDGIDINETLQNAIGYSPSPFSIQEVHVITGNADAEYGNVNGGEVVMVTKTGTNEFHGSAFMFHQNSGLDANTWANKYTATPRTAYNQNQFGAAVGGPIIKNKLFFFGNYEGLRYNTQGYSSSSVPTSAMRGLSSPGPYTGGNGDPASSCSSGYGDFSAILPAYDIQLWDTSSGTNTENEYAGNCVPINPNNVLFTVLNAHPSVFPLPNHAPNPGTIEGGNYQGLQSSIQRNDQGDIRIDYTLSGKDTFMGKFSYGDAWDTPTQVPVTAVIPFTDDYPFMNVVGAWTHIFSSTIVNNARAGLTRLKLNASVPKDLSGLFGNNGETVAGIGLNPGWLQTQSGYAYIDVSSAEGWNLQNFGSEPPIQGPAVDNNFDYNDTVNWEHGKHITKAGFEFLRYQQDYVSTSDTGGTLGYLQYNGNPTANWNASGNDEGYGYADFLLDEASRAEITDLHGLFGQRQWRDAIFVQDDWKILPNLTLNLGLRYSYMQPNYEVNNKMDNVNVPYAVGQPFGTPIDSMLSFAGAFNPTTGKTNSRALINPYRLGFMPRVGFAYSVTPKFVVRGGYGSTDDLESTGTSLRMTQNPQFQPAVLKSSPGPSGNSQGPVYPMATALVGAPSSTGGQYYAWDENMRPAVIQQFNLSLQYQIDSHTAVQAGYVGQVGQHLAVPIWANQYTTDDTCQNMNPGSAQDACYQAIEPFYALVGTATDYNGTDNPGTGIVKYTASRAISNYHSLQVSLQRHMSEGLEFLVNYTYGKSMTNNVGYFGVTNSGDSDSYWQDANNPRGDYGPSSFDARQVVSATGVYQLPFGRGRQFGASWPLALEEVLGGWQLSLNAQLNTGYPLTIHQSGNQCNNNCSQGTNGSQDYFGFANRYGYQKIVGRGRQPNGSFAWFGTDPSAQPCTTRGTSPTATDNVSNPNCAYGRPSQDFGTTRTGTERGPGFQNYDLSLSKAFKTVKEEALKARLDAFNAFNIASYSNPNTYIGGSLNTYGYITGTNSGPRKIQVSLIYEF